MNPVEMCPSTDISETRARMIVTDGWQFSVKEKYALFNIYSALINYVRSGKKLEIAFLSLSCLIEGLV